MEQVRVPWVPEAPEEPIFSACWCVVDDVTEGVWELLFYLLPLCRIFGLFVKGDVDLVDVTSYVDNAVVGVSICICNDESEGFLLGSP